MIESRVSATAPGVPLKHFWTEVAGAGRAAEALRFDWQRQLRTLQHEIGYRFVRFHGLFHDDMFVYRELEGQVEPSFHHIDTVFDELLAQRIRPFVEFGFAPRELARSQATVFWWRANGAPPTDLAKWERLVELTARHWVERYGIDEVAGWYFEIWNEPNLAPFFDGTRSEYFELYRRSVTALKRVDQRLRVGGPATSNFVPDARFAGEREDVTQHAVVAGASDLDALDWQPVWLTEFLAFCAENTLPVDFVSAHPYPTDWALDEHSQGQKFTRGTGATPRDLALLRKMVDESPYPEAEIHLTEWSSSSSSRDHTHDSVPAATFVVKANLESIGLVDSLAYWTFTDVFEEEGAGQEPFHGGFGMLNQNGLPKPTFHAYRFLASLGDTLLHRAPGIVVARSSATGALSAVAYHYPPEQPLSVPASFDSREVADATLALGSPETLVLDFDGVTPGTRFVVETVDGSHGNVIDAWRERGSPANPTRADVAFLQTQAWATEQEVVVADANGRVRIERELQPWSIVRIGQEPGLGSKHHATDRDHPAP